MGKIEFLNIETNNLKGIDFVIYKNKINCVIGPSGSGKSSLIFDTCNAIIDSEYKRMIGESDDSSDYVVEDYSNLIFSVPLKQLNHNNNPRSTIATYYKIDEFLKEIFASHFNLNISEFSFNKYSSSCKSCNGLGYKLVPDISLIIDYDLSVNDNPFIPWRGSYKDFYSQLLCNVAKDLNIPLDIPFRELSDVHAEFLIYGSGEKKYKIDYTQTGRKRVKTTKYLGLIPELKQKIQSKSNDLDKYLREETCDKCKGTRFSERINQFKIASKSIGEVYMLSINDLDDWISECEKILKKDIRQIKLLNSLRAFLSKVCSVNLDYIHLNRSISTLSGGEFQRLRLSQLLENKFGNILFILDEPLSSLHVAEKKQISNLIVELKKNNTVLVVEHNSEFFHKCDKIVALGESGGKNGGNWINVDSYIKSVECRKYVSIRNSESTFHIKNSSLVNNVRPFELEVPMQTCIGICGFSGSGKTTFAKEILPRTIPNYKYISQKPIRGNVYSEVGSYIGALDKIRQVFSNENNVQKSLFSHHFSAEGACQKCKGIGKISISDYKMQQYYKCPDCNGEKYSAKALEYKYENYNISEILSLEIEEAIKVFKKETDICEVLNNAIDIGLGYIKLNQSIETLSGGENQRIKLLKYLHGSRNKILALDEPFQGLSSVEIFKIFTLLDKFVGKGNTILIIEHNTYALELCSYLLEFGEGSGVNGGNILYFGRRDLVGKSEKSIIKNYLRIEEEVL